jgi:hypothetical protein
VTCAIRAWEGRAAYERMQDDLQRRFASSSVADVVRGLDEHLPGESFALPQLFLDERRGVLARVTSAILARHEETYRQIWEEHRKLMRYLREADAPIPEALAIVTRHVLEQEALGELARIEDGGPLPPRVAELIDEAEALGLALDLTPGKPALQRAVQAALAAIDTEPVRARIASAQRLIEDARALGLRFGLWQAQNRFFDLWQAHPDERRELAPLGVVLGFNLTGEPA